MALVRRKRLSTLQPSGRWSLSASSSKLGFSSRLPAVASTVGVGVGDAPLVGVGVGSEPESAMTKLSVKGPPAARTYDTPICAADTSKRPKPKVLLTLEPIQ